MSDLLALLDPDLAAGDDRPSQFTLTRFQLINWGTFKGFWEAEISADGHLITGESGKGKSTLLDAMSAVMFAPKDLDFNAAARDAITKGRDRTLLTYVRGAYAQRPDEEGNTAVQYLRPGAAWSALALEFTHPERGVVTLVRAFRASESAASVEQLTKVAMIFERPFNIGAREFEDIVRIRLDSGALKRTFAPTHIGTDFGSYQERYLHLFGIQGDRALRLLQKTQAMKGLNTLDGLLKDFMLDEPETFTHADRAVVQFGNLRAAYEAVTTARDQRDLLHPIVEHKVVIDASAENEEALSRELDGIRRVRAERAIAILEESLRTGEDALTQVNATIDGIDARIRTLNGEIQSLRADYDHAGGGAIHAIDIRIDALATDHSKRVKNRTAFEHTIDAAGFTMPSGRNEFVALVRTARAELREMAAEAEGRKGAVYAAHDHVTAARDELSTAQRELDALTRRPSNVYARDGELRDRIAVACSVPAGSLPFVAELLQVRSGDEEWAGAIERVLHGFALSILVPREYYRAVAQYVNDTHQHGKVVFYPVDTDLPAPHVQPSLNSIIRKLDLAPGFFGNWILSRLVSRLDYQCADSIDGLDKDIQAVTRNGLERGRGDRHIKDDRASVNDRGNWILGFDNTAKRSLYEKTVGRLRLEMGAAVEARTIIENEEKTRAARERALVLLDAQDWDEVDDADAMHLLETAQRTRDSILNGNSNLEAVATRLTRAGADRDAELVRRDDAVEKRGAASATRQGMVTELADEHQALKPLPAVPKAVADAIAARLDVSGPTSTVRALNDAVAGLHAAITAQITAEQSRAAAAHSTLLLIFSKFIGTWPERSGDVDDTFKSLPAFMKILDTLVRDRLPEFEGEFRKLMHDGPTRHLTDLSRKLDEERRAIDRRMDPINDALAGTDFNRGTYLKIVITDLPHQALQDFKRQLRDFAQANALAPEDTAEERYGMLSAILNRLGSDDPKDISWKQQVLDVRKHVAFAADERRGDEVIDRHTSGNGRSGGQRVKLVTFTLAAALRYQLTDGYSDVPVFAPVIIDEAFSKADAQFTEQSLQVFKSFGFQLILATPNKMLSTFQHFIGGATVVHRSDDTQLSSLLPIRMEKIVALGSGEDSL